MKALALVDRVWVKFGGDRGGDGPMTLAQRNTYQWVGALGADRFLSMDEWVFQVPAGAGLEDVAAAWGVLMSRHESLRTTYPAGCVAADGSQAQRVAVSGELGIGVYQVADPVVDPAAVAHDLTGVLRSEGFDMGTDLPVRVGVATGPDGAILAVVGVFSHMAVDFASMAVLGRQFIELAGDRSARGHEPRGHQPLDQAEAERSPRGRTRAAASLRYWEDQLRRRPQCLYALPEAVSGQDAGRPLACWMYSPAAAMALPHVTSRSGASPAMVALAAVSAVLSRRAGVRECFLASPSGNRLGPQLRDYVGTLAQDSLIVVDADTDSFDDLVRRAGSASLRAHRHSTFDAGELQRLHDAISRQRGVALTRDCSIDNLVGLRLDEIHATGEAGAAEVPAGSPAQAEAALDQTLTGWWEPPDMTETLRFHLVNLGAGLRFTLWAADTRRVPREEFGLILGGVERLLVAAAGGDVDLGRLGEVAGVSPAVRGEGWVRVDSCWVELAQCQRLAEEALPGSGVRVFAVPGADGELVLTAFLEVSGELADPERAHAACMRLLPGRPTAMAPGWYVLCGGVPADPGDLDAWLDQPVLVNGSGR